ncbi:Delta-1-pyrroline-5-carboxylate dehydrogenase-like protein, partial [Daphnia magna]
PTLTSVGHPTDCLVLCGVIGHNTGYLKGSSERSFLEDALQHRQATCEEISIVIAGKEYWTDDVHYQTMVSYIFYVCMDHVIANSIFLFFIYPFNHPKKIENFCYATPELLQKSISASLEARKRLPEQQFGQLYQQQLKFQQEVFDGVAKSKYGPSLYNVLEIGLNLNPDLLAVLMRLCLNGIELIAGMK